MKRYVITNAQGQIVRTVLCEEAQATGQVQDEEAITESETATVGVHYFDGADFVLFPERTGACDVWDWKAHGWHDPRTLDALKADKWDRVKAERSRRESGTFDCGGLTFDCNEPALAGATLDAFMAKIAGGDASTAWVQPWVLADNSVAALNADQMIAAGQACKAYISGLWSVSQALRHQIDAAQTADEIAAITWPA